MSSSIVESQPTATPIGGQASAPETCDTTGPPFPVRQFSVAEYELLGQYDILSQDDNVELLEGWISEKMTKYPLHVTVLAKLFWAIHNGLPAGFHIRTQEPITTSDSVPEPDLAIVRGGLDDYAQRHPVASEVVLVIEVADSSLGRDRKKARIYGRAGLKHYWIVNLNERCVEVYSDPITTEPAGYPPPTILSMDDTAQFTLSENLNLSIPVAEFMPK